MQRQQIGWCALPDLAASFGRERHVERLDGGVSVECVRGWVVCGRGVHDETAPSGEAARRIEPGPYSRTVECAVPEAVRIDDVAQVEHPGREAVRRELPRGIGVHAARRNTLAHAAVLVEHIGRDQFTTFEADLRASVVTPTRQIVLREVWEVGGVESGWLCVRD